MSKNDKRCRILSWSSWGSLYSDMQYISRRMGRTERGGLKKLASCWRAVPGATQAILRHLLILIACSFLQPVTILSSLCGSLLGYCAFVL